MISRLAQILVLSILWAGGVAAAEPPGWDQGRSVYERRVRPAEAPEKVDWEARVSALLREEPGDLVVAAVGDLIFNERISHLGEPERKNLLRILQEADVAIGNLEFSLNDRPELQKPFYNFRAPREFAWEVAASGFSLVGLANNHALDFGREGLLECLRALDLSGIAHAGAGKTLAEAHEPGTVRPPGQKQRLALLSYVRYWTDRDRCTDPSGPCIATIDPATVLVARDGKVEAVEGPQERDVKAMEEDVLLARRHHGPVLVAYHVHDVSHARAWGVQDTTPPNEEIPFRRAIDAGADAVLGSGPHVLRGIEIRDGKPIFYSLGNFVYQYRTPKVIPTDLPHQRDSEMPREANVSVWDRRDSREVMESVVARMTWREGKLKKLQLIPVTIDDEGPLYGVPRLASTRRAREIVELLARLSAPYGTKIALREWYGEVELP
ncbi:MAG: CapA family protein [Thermoanaerobaculia bacterium]|nr:CapA family protein [Thermoanaerobaculia bacterium]